MAYEAMLAGLEMTPFRGGITVKDLEPKIGQESMSRLYTFLEYVFFIKWEVHSESRPPLLKNPPPLPFRTSEQPRAAEDFSRSVRLSYSLVPIVSLNKATKSLASQTSQADLRSPQVAFICVLAQEIRSFR